jgi:protein-S-isoprenylcysteine O-methyltransferase Ste14
MMSVLIRAMTYATLFIGFVLVFLPSRALSAAGVERPAGFAAPQLAGTIVGAAGAALALWCIFSFVFVGRGTPAPFDPPRRLVVRGPYRYLRNPMYLGAGLALAGAALFYQALVLWAYAGGFLLLLHAFVVFYEEPTLRRTFGEPYATYCREVHRWRPRVSPVLGSAIFFAVAPGTVAGWVPYALTRWRMEPPLLGLPAIRWIGAALVLAGAAVLLESFARFALVGKGTPAPVAPTEELVVSGLYRHVRNPMYVGVLAAIVGQALLFGSTTLLIYAGVVWTAFHVFVLGYEEPTLRARYGDSYRLYQREVRRWWPRLRPSRRMSSARSPKSTVA